MKFYKVHAAKFKTQKVFFMPEQYDEIGPDAFSQTNFDIIVLSRKVKTIKNHAFSDLRRCKVYIPKTVSEIEPLAFENIDIGNEFYCVNGSEAFKLCLENDLKVNEDIETFIEYAENLKLEEEKHLKVIAEQTKNTQAEQKEIEKKSELSNIQDLEEPKENKPQIIENEIEVIPEATVEPKVMTEEDETLEEEADEELFVEKYGLPPVVDFYSDMGEGWKKQISQMLTEDIIANYDSNEYCEEYRYYCYLEIKKRFLENKMDIKPKVQEEIVSSKEPEKPVKIEAEEPSYEQIEENEITALLGVPPKCSETSGFNEEWKQQLEALSTREVLERYDSEEWCEEYRYLCYQELSKRKDLENVLFESE